MNCELKAPISEDDWKVYHKIRREVLFEARGRYGVYDEQHPDEHVEGNYPQIYSVSGEIIGVVRIDLERLKHQATFRRLAIREDKQRNGYGRYLMMAAEAFASANSCSYFIANVSLDAIGFYEQIGYRLDPENPENDAKNPCMIKPS